MTTLLKGLKIYPRYCCFFTIRVYFLSNEINHLKLYPIYCNPLNILLNNKLNGFIDVFSSLLKIHPMLDVNVFTKT